MKSIKKEHFLKLIKVLAAAYHGKEKVETDELWQARVMGHIRDLGPLHPLSGYLDLLQGLVWRIAPVACILVLLLGIAMTQIDFVSDYELAKMIAEDPADFTMLVL